MSTNNPDFFDRVVEIRGGNADAGDNMDFCYLPRLEKLSVISEDHRIFLPKHTHKSFKVFNRAAAKTH